MSEFDTQQTLIIGASGRLARAFRSRWQQAVPASHGNLDIADREATLSLVEHLRPSLVVNCAALTDMRRCEAEPDLAWSVNVRGVCHLAEACQAVGAILVHFSSDYALKPVNEYAWTKLASESLADLTIRAKLYDGSHWAWKSLRQGQCLQMLTTEYLNPISTTGLVPIVEALLRQNQRGVVFAGTRDRLSFWETGCVWAGILGAKTTLVEPVESLPAAGKRLANMYLATDQLAKLGIAVPTLADDAASHRDWYDQTMSEKAGAL